MYQTSPRLKFIHRDMSPTKYILNEKNQPVLPTMLSQWRKINILKERGHRRWLLWEVKLIKQANLLNTFFMISLMWAKKRIGPKTYPRGTPDSSSKEAQLTSHLGRCVFVRFGLIVAVNSNIQGDFTCFDLSRTFPNLWARLKHWLTSF